MYLNEKLSKKIIVVNITKLNRKKNVWKITWNIKYIF